MLQNTTEDPGTMRQILLHTYKICLRTYCTCTSHHIWASQTTTTSILTLIESACLLLSWKIWNPLWNGGGDAAASGGLKCFQFISQLSFLLSSSSKEDEEETPQLPYPHSKEKEDSNLPLTRYWYYRYCSIVLSDVSPCLEGLGNRAYLRPIFIDNLIKMDYTVVMLKLKLNLPSPM